MLCKITLDVISQKCAYKYGKSLFLTIQFWPQFGFGHRSSKPDIFGHPTIKTVKI